MQPASQLQHRQRPVYWGVLNDSCTEGTATCFALRAIPSKWLKCFSNIFLATPGGNPVFGFDSSCHTTIMWVALGQDGDLNVEEICSARKKCEEGVQDGLDPSACLRHS